MEVDLDKVANHKWNKSPNKGRLGSAAVHPPVSPLSHNNSLVNEVVKRKENAHVRFKEGNFLGVKLADLSI